MKKIMTRFWDAIIRFTRWYRKREILDMPNGPFWTFIIYILIAVLVYYLKFLPGEILARIAVALMISMFLIVAFMAKDKWVKRFTKDKFETPMELLKNFSNVSYLYGVVFWISTGELLLYCIIYILFTLQVPLFEFTIINVMGFTFLWFTYHLYMNNELGSVKNKYSIIELKLKLFAAIASSFSAMLLFFESWKELKIMVTMLALVFTWLRYIIDAEKQREY